MASSNEIQVSGLGGITFVVSRAAAALEKDREVVLSAINSGIPNVVQAAELLKHRISGLYQVNLFERVPNSTKTRVSIHLSLSALDASHTGYQAPLSVDQVTAVPYEELKNRPVRRMTEESKGSPDTDSGFRGRRGRGRGMRGGSTRGGYGDGALRPVRRDYVDMDKYRKVQGPTDLAIANPGELSVNLRQPLRSYVKDAVLWFKRDLKAKLKLKASGWSIAQAVQVAEEIKRAVPGLYQIASYGKRIVTDVFEPIESGLEAIRKDRAIPLVEIQLSTVPVDTKDPGYQPPLSDSLVRPLTIEEAEKLV